MPQLTLNQSQLESLIENGLMNEDRFSECSTHSRDGSYKDRNGKLVVRTTIFIPETEAGNLVSGADILAAVKGKAVEEEISAEADDLAKEIGAE